MSKETFSDTLIRLEAFKRNICISSSNRLFSKGFWPKMTKFCRRQFSLVFGPMDFGVF